MHARRLGFTLIELMVVVVILGLLIGIVAPNVIKHLRDTARTTAQTQMSQIGSAVEMYHIQKLRLPDSLDVLTEVDESGDSYIAAIPRDPWDGAYEYAKITRRRYEIRCLGEDGVAQTEDDLVHPVYLRER